MKNTTWHTIQPGQIIRFSYKSIKDQRGVERTILVLDPKYRYRKKSTGRIVEFLVGIQLDTFVTPPINVIKFEQLINKLGGLSFDEGVKEVGSFPDSNRFREQTKKLYTSIKGFLDKNDLFRTYFLRECRKRRVFLLDSYRKFPKDATNKLLLERKFQKRMEQIEEF